MIEISCFHVSKLPSLLLKGSTKCHQQLIKEDVDKLQKGQSRTDLKLRVIGDQNYVMRQKGIPLPAIAGCSVYCWCCLGYLSQEQFAIISAINDTKDTMSFL